MISAERIRTCIDEELRRNDLFLIDLVVSSSNRIKVVIDSMKGITVDECARLSRTIENKLDRDEEDFDLEVSSPGLDRPLVLPFQYLKNTGRQIEVLTMEENINLIETFSEFKELKSIDRTTMMSVIEDVFRNLLIKMYGTADNFDIIINIDKGDFEIWRNREVVEDGKVEDPNMQISLSEAKKIDSDYEIGEDVTDEVKLKDFGRRAILALRQNLTARILDLEKNNVYLKYRDRIGDIVTGEVYQVWKREILVLDEEGNELILPKTDQIPSDYFRKGDTIRAVVIKGEMRNNNPLIVLSRTSPVFLERLFELEVPEIFDGLITIKKIVRIPGERAKVA